MKRTAMKRSLKPMKRGKPLGIGKKMKAKRKAIGDAMRAYVRRFGYVCQLTGYETLHLVAHHKQPRSEMRKAGIKDLDAPCRLLMISHLAHTWVHAGQMGRPKGEVVATRFEAVETCDADAENGERVELSPQHRLDLERFLYGEG